LHKTPTILCDKDGDNMKVALYIRVSTKDKKQNPETQLGKLREFCRSRNFEIYKEYVDIASGANWNRPQLQQLMGDARHHHFDAVIVTKLDRFGRSLIDLSQSIESFRLWNIDFICVDQPVDTTIPSGKLLFHLLSAISEFERELIRDRVKDGLRRAKAEGKQLGRPKKTLDEKEVFHLYEEFNSTRKVAEKLGVSHVLIYNLLLKKHPQILQRRKNQKTGVHNRNDKLTKKGGIL